MSNLTSYTNAITQPQVGEIIAIPETTAPPGYLPCNGSIVSQATYSALYQQVGLIQDNISTPVSRNSNTGQQANTLIYANNLFIFGRSGGAIETSTNGITWTTVTSGTLSSINSIIYANGLYVYGGGGGVLATSTDAITWTARTSGTTSGINALTYGNGIYVYAGAGGILRTSTDAITWTARTSGTTSGINALTYGNGIFVYAGTNGVLATSTDAITWTPRNSVFFGTITLNSLTYANGLYVYGSVLQGGRIGTSTDAITWTIRSAYDVNPAASTINAVGYYNNLYTCLSNNIFQTSTDAITWKPYTLVGTFLQYALAYGNNRYVIGDTGGRINTLEPYSYNTSTDFALPNIQSKESLNFYIKF